VVVGGDVTSTLDALVAELLEDVLAGLDRDAQEAKQ
jgi:hypothetical protein